MVKDTRAIFSQLIAYIFKGVAVLCAWIYTSLSQELLTTETLASKCRGQI